MDEARRRIRGYHWWAWIESVGNRLRRAGGQANKSLSAAVRMGAGLGRQVDWPESAGLQSG